MKELVLNKKKSIKLSIIIPIICTLILIIGYSFLPDFNEEHLNIAKSTWSLIPVLSFILSISMFWATLFFAKPKFKSDEIFLERKKYIKNSFLSYIIVCVLLILFITITPTNNELSFDYVAYMKANIQLVIFTSVIISIIQTWLILFSSKKKEKK